MNGNITTMYRTDADGGTLHDISYHYNGNQLTSVNINNTPSALFKYDLDGNMTFDGEKGISIEYNELNLPARIFANSDEIRYIYSSLGDKLATITNGSLTYYRNVMVYGKEANSSAENLLYLSHPEGLVARSTSGWNYKYFKKDHLGNTRSLLSAVDTPSGTELNVDQTTDYYPYGVSWTYNNLHQNRYLYGGKELQDQTINGDILKLYDFGSRYYNPLLGCWFNIDPALQFTNPYLYCANSPMMYVDPDGELAFLAVLGIAAVIGGTMNVAMHWNDIDGFWNGAGYFGIGAAAGAAGAAAGASAASSLGFVTTGALGTFTFGSGGFVAGATMATSSYTASTLVLSGGNHLAYGHEIISNEDFWKGFASSAVIGGVINGIGAVVQGNDFFVGKGIPTDISVGIRSTQNHHFASDKNKRFTPSVKEIAEAHGLKLNGDWNKAMTPNHVGRHTDIYHEFVLTKMREISEISQGDQSIFLRLYKEKVIDFVKRNPGMLYKPK